MVVGLMEALKAWRAAMSEERVVSDWAEITVVVKMRRRRRRRDEKENWREVEVEVDMEGICIYYCLVGKREGIEDLSRVWFFFFQV